MVTRQPSMRRWLLAAAVALVAALDANAQDRPWTPDVSVAMRYFGHPPFYEAGRVVPSSTGEKFFVMTMRGDASNDTNVYELLVFSLGREAVQLERTFTMVSATSQPGISRASWSDPRIITFLGARGSAPPQVFRANVESGAIEQLTNAPLGVDTFSEREGNVIYLSRTVHSPSPHEALYPAALAPANAPWFLFDTPEWDPRSTFVQPRRGRTRQVGPSYRPIPQQLMYWMAPSGDWAIARHPMQSAAARRQLDWNEFILLNLRSGAIVPIFGAPVGWAAGNFGSAEALWSDDGTHVVIANTLVRGDWSNSDISDNPKVLFFDIATRSYSVIVEQTNARSDWIVEMTWIEIGRILRLKFADNTSVQYTLNDGRWEAAPRVSSNVGVQTAAPLAHGFTASIVESSNEPPELVVRNPNGDQIRPVAADPALLGVGRTPVENFSWTDREGRSWAGGLLLPLNQGRDAIPLVVQAYNFRGDRFLPDGASTSGYAARALAARGIAVLQMPLTFVGAGPEVNAGGPVFVEGLDAAIDELTRREIIDPDRVGVLGFSRGGFAARFAASNPGDHRLAAAISADGFGAAYYEYTITLRPAAIRAYEMVYGGSFWRARDRWLETEPSFVANRTTTPILLMPIGPGPLLDDLQLFGALRHNGRAAEVLYFPSGEHSLVRPRERLAALQGTLDWMLFWLTGEEDSMVQKAEQYARWRSLRAEHCSATSNSQAAWYCNPTIQ